MKRKVIEALKFPHFFKFCILYIIFLPMLVIESLDFIFIKIIIIRFWSIECVVKSWWWTWLFLFSDIMIILAIVWSWSWPVSVIKSLSKLSVPHVWSSMFLSKVLILIRFTKRRSGLMFVSLCRFSSVVTMRRSGLMFFSLMRWRFASAVGAVFPATTILTLSINRTEPLVIHHKTSSLSSVVQHPPTTLLTLSINRSGPLVIHHRTRSLSSVVRHGAWEQKQNLFYIRWHCIFFIT